MFRYILKKIPTAPLASTVCVGVGLSAGTYMLYNFNENNFHPHLAFNYSRRLYPASAEYPNLVKNRNIMARNMNKSLYAKLRDFYTSNGFSIDDAIQTGVDNIGSFSSSGIVAGDEESYIVGSIQYL
jgi:hypothetical protein